MALCFLLKIVVERANKKVLLITVGDVDWSSFLLSLHASLWEQIKESSEITVTKSEAPVSVLLPLLAVILKYRRYEVLWGEVLFLCFFNHDICLSWAIIWEQINQLLWLLIFTAFVVDFGALGELVTAFFYRTVRLIFMCRHVFLCHKILLGVLTAVFFDLLPIFGDSAFLRNPFGVNWTVFIVTAVVEDVHRQRFSLPLFWGFFLWHYIKITYFTFHIKLFSLATAKTMKRWPYALPIVWAG